MSDFARKLLAWRTARRITQAAAVEYLSGKIGAQIVLRSYQRWEAGEMPLGIGRAVIEKTIEGEKC